MRVLFWLNIGLDRHSTSGHLLLAMIEKVKCMGNDVQVLHKNTGGQEKDLLDKLNSLKVECVGIPFIQPPKSNFAKRYLAELDYIRKSSKYLKDFDAVFIQSNIAAGFSVCCVRLKRPKTRITYNVQDVYPQDVMYAGKIGSNNIAYKVMLGIQRFAYKHSDAIITISEDMKNLIIGAGAPKEKVFVIYNWSYQDVPFNEMDIKPSVKSFFDKDYFNVVYAGNIGLFQNVSIVIDAAEMLSNDKGIMFHIFGEGLYKEQLKKRTMDKQLNNVIFHPLQPHESAPSIYASASVNLIPLGKDQYKASLPSKTATCLACQKPIVFTIGEDSLFGKMVHQETNCPVLNYDDVKGLVSTILDIKAGNIQMNTRGFFEEHCSIEKNSMEYARIIVGKDAIK